MLSVAHPWDSADAMYMGDADLAIIMDLICNHKR